MESTASTSVNSLQRMKLKAAQLAEELQHARAGSDLPQAGNSSRQNAAAGLGQGPAYPAFVSLLGEYMPAHPKSSTSNIYDAERPSESATISHQAAALRCQSLEAEVQLWKAKHVDAIQELERCQASYMRREAQLKAELDNLQHQQQVQGCNSPAADAGSICASGCEGSAKGQQTQKPPTFSEMQQQVLQGLDDLLQRQKLQLQAEEAQQLRHFRSKLSEIEGQLQADKQVAAAHQDGWMAKTVALRDELARTQEIASKLDAMYKLAEEEAVQLRVQFKAQEDDRQHLIRQLLMYKRDNNRLKQQLKTVEEELDAVIVLSAEPAEAVPELHHRNDLATVVSQVAERRARGAAGCSNRHVTECGAAGPSRRPQSAAPGGSRYHTGSEGPTLRPWSAAAASRPLSPLPGDLLGPDMDAASVAVKMQRYSHVIQKLQKLLECERRQLRQVRQSYASELSRRTELQTLLLDSIQQAKQQYRHAELASHAAVKQGGCGLAPAAVSSSADKAWRKPRPATASAACSTSTARCRAWQRPSSAADHAFSAPHASDPPLKQQSWDVVLDKVLAKQELLEMLFDKMFPEFMAGATDVTCCRESPVAVHTRPATHQPLGSCLAEDSGEQQVHQQQQQDGPPQALRQASWQADRLDDIVEVLDDTGDSCGSLSDGFEEEGPALDHPGGSNCCSAPSTHCTPESELAVHKTAETELGMHWQQTPSSMQPADSGSFNQPSGSLLLDKPPANHVLPFFPAKKALHCSPVRKDGSPCQAGLTFGKGTSRPSSAAPIMLGTSLTTKAAVQGRPATACAGRRGNTESRGPVHIMCNSRPATSCSSAQHAVTSGSHILTGKASKHPVAVQSPTPGGERASQAVVTNPALSFDTHSITRSFLAS